MTVVACAGGSGGDISGPGNGTGKVTPLTVSFTQPREGESDFALNWSVSANFGEGLDSTSPTSAFTVKQGNTPVTGTVTYQGAVATFTPDADLGVRLSYTATLSTALKDVDGGMLATPYAWSFTTGDCDRFLRVDSFPLGPEAADEWSQSMTTDGTNIYLLINTESAADYVTLMTIDPQAKAVTGSIRIPVVPPRTAYSPPVPDGIGEVLDIAWYNGALWASGGWWVAATQSGYSGVFELDPATGKPTHTIALPHSSDPNHDDFIGSIASDGTDLYVSVKRQYYIPYTDTTMIVKLDPGSTSQISTASPFFVSPAPMHQMDFDGGFLWVLTEENPDRIDKVDPNTAKTLSQTCMSDGGNNILYVDGDFWSASGSEMKILSLK
jgi:hypothetical protein